MPRFPLIYVGCGLLVAACSSHKAPKHETVVSKAAPPAASAAATRMESGVPRDVGIVSIVQLIATPEKFNGAVVTVEGYAVLEAGAQYLFSSPDLAYSKYNGIWIEKHIENAPSEEKPVRFFHVMVTGTFASAGRPTLRALTRFDIRGEKLAGAAEESQDADWVAYGSGKEPDTGYEIVDGERTSGWILLFPPGKPHDVATALRIPMTLVGMSATEYRGLVLDPQAQAREYSIRFLDGSDSLKRRAMIQLTTPPSVPQEYTFYRRL